MKSILLKTKRTADQKLHYKSQDICVELGQIIQLLSQYKHQCIVLILLSLYISPASARYCTVLRNRKIVKYITKQEPCIQAYKAACGWFSSEQCTFYEHVMCDREINQTKTIYSIVTECCPGYVMLKNRTCMKSNDGLYADDEDNTISHGVFAGISCGAIFIICVIILIVIHIKKNEKKKIVMNQEHVQMKDQLERMITEHTLETESNLKGQSTI